MNRVLCSDLGESEAVDDLKEAAGADRYCLFVFVPAMINAKTDRGNLIQECSKLCDIYNVLIIIHGDLHTITSMTDADPNEPFSGSFCADHRIYFGIILYWTSPTFDQCLLHDTIGDNNMRILKDPLEIVTINTHKGEAKVFSFVPKRSYVDSFSYEWTHYGETQIDSLLRTNISKSYLELTLGFPLEFLKNLNVLEIGCGPGRFTEYFATHAKHVVAVDLSDAIYHNGALASANVIGIHADFWDLPPLSEAIDVVFCRGVLQHTPDPATSIRKLFDFIPEGGLVIFDVYRKKSGDWRNFKYFWRPIFKKYVPIDKFDRYLSKYANTIYRFHHAWLRSLRKIKPLQWVLIRTPFYLHTDWDALYPNLTKEQRLGVFKGEIIDMLYSHFDQPMSAQEVINVLASIGQRPYSYELQFNRFRCRKIGNLYPIKVKMTKNGVLDVLP